MTDDNQTSSDETIMLPASELFAMSLIFDRFMSGSKPFGFTPPSTDRTYHPLPYKPEPDDELLLKTPWRVELELHTAGERQVLGLDLYGDVILGRGRSKIGKIIVDLETYGASSMGVSRTHLLLRPTPTRLFAIDQGSTNRTAINSVPMGKGIAKALSDKDMLTLGNMLLQLHIVTRPE